MMNFNLDNFDPYLLGIISGAARYDSMTEDIETQARRVYPVLVSQKWDIRNDTRDLSLSRFIDGYKEGRKQIQAMKNKELIESVGQFTIAKQIYCCDCAKTTTHFCPSMYINNRKQEFYCSDCYRGILIDTDCDES